MWWSAGRSSRQAIINDNMPPYPPGETIKFDASEEFYLGDVELRSLISSPNGESLLFVVRDGSGRDGMAVETLSTRVPRVLIY